MTETNERLVVKPALETVRAFDGPLDLDLGTLLASDGAALDVTAADGARAEVEFVARYRVGGGSAVRLHERSRFVHEDGHWHYLDGEQHG